MIMRLEAESVLQTPIPCFSIQGIDDYFRITGVGYCGMNTAWDFTSKTSLTTQDKHAKQAARAKPHEFRACDAPLVYALSSTLYLNRNGAQKELVEKARQSLEAFFNHEDDPFVCTLSRIMYNPHSSNGLDEVIHVYKRPDSESKFISNAEPSGNITATGTQAKARIQALFDTEHSTKQVNEVFNWITGKNSFIGDRRDMVVKKKEVWAVAMGVNSYANRFEIKPYCWNNSRRALMVRPLPVSPLENAEHNYELLSKPSYFRRQPKVIFLPGFEGIF